MKKILFGFTGLFLLAISIQSCGDRIDESYKDYSDEEYDIISKRLNLPSEVFEYSTDFQNNFFVNNLGKENIHARREAHKATLGRVLFYDNMLSINETISCASCHKQEIAFADDVALSEGFDGELTTRNSLPLGNTIGFETAYGRGGQERALFSWDEANNDITSQSRAAIISEIEMGLDMNTLVNRIRNDEIYNVLFAKAYGDNAIFEHRVLESIEEFVNSIASADSKFDHEFMKFGGDVTSDFSGFTTQENEGRILYNSNCSTCHSIDHKFTSKAVANNGLDLEYEDKGIGARTLNSSENGVFKVPFLRNIEHTGPYMHDGRFETLRDVIDHYSEGIANHPNLDLKLKSGNDAIRMNFTEGQKQSLEIYLKTLTDEKLLADVRFSNPFK